MSLPMERWTIYTEPRMKHIDAELKEKLAPFGASRSARFRFAYDLAFAIICGDRTNAMVAAVLAGYQETKTMSFSHKFPAPLPPAGEERGPESRVAPFRIKGFQDGICEFESLLQHAAGVN
jgi:hypothetical protein